MRASLCVSRAGVVLSGVPAVGGACAPLPVHSGQGPQVSRASQGRQRPRVPGQERAARKGSLPGRLTTEDSNSSARAEATPLLIHSAPLHRGEGTMPR